MLPARIPKLILLPQRWPWHSPLPTLATRLRIPTPAKLTTNTRTPARSQPDWDSRARSRTSTHAPGPPGDRSARRSRTPFHGRRTRPGTKRQLADLEARSSRATTPAYWGDDLNRWQVVLDLGIAELRLGRLEAGIEHLLAAYRLLPKIKPYVKKSQVDKTIFELGVGYMRFGETQNCALLHSAESCLLPLRGGGIHTLRGARRRRSNTSLRCWRAPSGGNLRLPLSVPLAPEHRPHDLGSISRKGAGTVSYTLVEFKSEVALPRFPMSP